MALPVHSPFHKELSGLTFFISLPQLIASPIMVGLKHLMYSDVVPFELKEVLDFLLISFPLTLCIAILFIIIEKGKFNLFYMVFAVVGAALLSNLLHMLVEKIPSVGIDAAFNTTYNNTANAGSSSAFSLVFNIFKVYCESFGPILFIQSCCIGIWAGIKLLKIEKVKNKNSGK